MSKAPVPKEVELLRRETLHQGFFRLDEVTLRHRRFDGGWTQPLQRTLFERRHAVAVLPFDPVRGEVVLIEQFRPGAWSALEQVPQWFRQDASAWLTEVVAGIVEQDETPEEVARRELTEECGLTARALRHVRSYMVSPGGSSECVTLFVAQVETGQVGGLHGLAQEQEDIRAFPVTLQSAWAMVDDGRICNTTAIIALDWLRANHLALADSWVTD